MEKSDAFAGLVANLLGAVSLEEAVGLLERGMIHQALARSEGNQSAASRLLQIHRNTMQRKMVEYGLGANRPRARRKPVSREARAPKAPRRRKTA